MHIEVRVGPSIDPCTHVLIGLVGRAELHCLGTSKGAIETIPRARSCEHPYLEGTTSSVLSFGTLSDSPWDYLRTTCGGKTAKANIVAVLHQGSSFVGCDKLQSHNSLCL